MREYPGSRWRHQLAAGRKSAANGETLTGCGRGEGEALRASPSHMRNRLVLLALANHGTAMMASPLLPKPVMVNPVAVRA